MLSIYRSAWQSCRAMLALPEESGRRNSGSGTFQSMNANPANLANLANLAARQQEIRSILHATQTLTQKRNKRSLADSMRLT